MTITGHVQESVALHPGNRLAHRGPALLETFGDSGAQRYDTLFLEVIDRPQIHLGGIDQIVHSLPSVTPSLPGECPDLRPNAVATQCDARRVCAGHHSACERV